MKKFFAPGVLGLLACVLTCAARAEDKTSPVVTRDNFVSLELFRKSDYKGAGVWLRLDNAGLRVKVAQKPQSESGEVPIPYFSSLWTEPAPASRAQIDSFLNLLNVIRFPQIAGYCYGKSKDAGFGEVLTLTISDAQNHDQKFEVQNFGDAAPREYSQLVKRLRAFQSEKFSTMNLPIPVEDWITESTFASLTLEMSGGIAGIHSIIKITPPPETSSNPVWMLEWSQTVGTEKTVRQGKLYNEDAQSLMRLLNAAQLAQLNGQNFIQPHLADGINEALTVQANYKTFAVSHYGDQAPQELKELLQFVRDLKTMRITDK